MTQAPERKPEVWQFGGGGRIREGKPGLNMEVFMGDTLPKS